MYLFGLNMQYLVGGMIKWRLHTFFERRDIEYNNVSCSFNNVTLQINIMYYYQMTLLIISTQVDLKHWS